MDIHFPYKSVTRHTADKPWVTDYFRHLTTQRHCALMSGGIDEARRLRSSLTAQGRNCVNDSTSRISRRWRKRLQTTGGNTQNLMGAPSSNTNDMHGLANKCTEGDVTQLVNSMNYFVVSVSADLPRLDATHRVFDIDEPALKQPLYQKCTAESEMHESNQTGQHSSADVAKSCTPVRCARHGYVQ